MPAFVRALFIKSSTEVELSYCIRKNVPWHILAPSAVACDIILLHASVHPLGAFLFHRTHFPMK